MGTKIKTGENPEGVKREEQGERIVMIPAYGGEISLLGGGSDVLSHLVVEDGDTLILRNKERVEIGRWDIIA